MSRRAAQWAMAVILILFVILGLGYAFTTPTLEAPDEIYHYGYIRSLVNTGQPPVLEEGGGKGFGHHAPLYYAAGALASFWVGENDLDLWPARRNLPYFGYRFGDVGRDNKNLYFHPEDDRFGASDTWLGVRVVRALSVLMGAVTIWVVYRVGCEVFPDQPEMAVGAAGLAAFIPEFLFISGAVNDDNGAALFGALALWAMARILREGPNLRRCLALGLALGLAWLSKLTVAALLPTAALALGLAVLHRGGRMRDLIRWGGVAFGVAALLIVPWLARQTILYGDPTGTSREMTEWGLREAPPTLTDLGPDLYWLRTSFWGRLGHNQVPLADWIYILLDLVTLFSCLGLARLAVRRLRFYSATINSQSPIASLQHPTSYRLLQFVLLAAAFLFTFAPMVVRRFLRPMPNFGRYLFPVLPAIALILFAGLAAWLPHRRRVYMTVAIPVGMLALGIAALLFFLAPAYTRPPIYDVADAPQPAHRLDWVYLEEGRPLARLLGYDLDREAVEPGETVRVTLYWEVMAETQSNYVLFVQVFGREGVKVGQRDTHTGLGHYPTSFWRSGQVIADEVTVPVDPAAVGPSRLRLDVGLYRRGDGERLAVVDEGGHAVGAATIGWLKLTVVGGIPEPAFATGYQLGDGIALIGYDLQQETGVLCLTLHWASLAPVERDYTVFIHLVAPDGTAAAQADGQPVGGDYPTSYWSFGDIVADERLIPTEGLPAGTYHLDVGMYLLETGERLPIKDAGGTPLPDGVLLLTEVTLP